MFDKKKTLELLEYINTPMSRESINILYMANNIKYEKCELFNDFVQSLVLLIFDTYLGDDVTNKEEQKNHFNWCWERNIENFTKEGIIFNGKKLYEYFINFMLEVFYTTNKKNQNTTILPNIQKLWNLTFNYTANKSKSDMDTLLEIYKLFDESIESK